MVIGHVAKDVVTTKFGTKEFNGGAGYHVAMAAAMIMPREVYLLCNIGVDFDESCLKRHGVLVDLINKQKNKQTDRHFLDESGSERRFYCDGDMNKSITLEKIDSIVADVGWIHMASSSPEQQNEWLDYLKKYRTSLFVSGDTFETYILDRPEKVAKIANRCDKYFLNELEWEKIHGEKLKIPVIKKLGGAGLEYYEQSVLKEKVVVNKIDNPIDTTGAGEVVSGVYLAARLLHCTDIYALRMAAVLARKSVTDYGTDHLRISA